MFVLRSYQVHRLSVSPPAVAHVRVRRHGEGFRLILGVFFRDAKKKEACRRAMAGGRWDNRGGWIVTPDKVHAIVRRLRESGFNVGVDDDAFELFERRELDRVHDEALVRDRLRRLDDAFRASGRSLYPFQFTGAVWMAQRDRALLGDDMGLGKTIQAIASLPSDVPVVVVCPATLKGNWAREFLSWRPSYRTSILAGDGSFRWPRPGEVVILNYDILPDSHGAGCPDRLPVESEGEEDTFDELVRRAEENSRRPPCAGCAPFLSEVPRSAVVIVDEVHWLKNERTRRASRFRALASVARASGGRSWGLSGTPLENRPDELWNVLSCLDLAHEAYGSHTRFVELHGGTVKRLGDGRYAGIAWDPEKIKPEAAERLGAVFLRRLKRDVLTELPPKEWRTVVVDIDRAALEEVEAELAKSGLSVDRVLAAIEEGRGEAMFTKLSGCRAALAAGKTKAVLDYVRDEFEAAEEPVVVFSAHRAPIDALGRRKGWASIVGGVSAKKRTEIVESFQAGKLKGIALTYGAGAEGLTLTRAWNLVRVDRPWTPSKQNQADDRIHRIGQMAARCVYTDLVCRHPIDQRVTEVIASKERTFELAVDAAAERRIA
jgi:SWI/SNF-related matrix-associated actin-dependent regulator of chromatin subfamily A-like protein 1